MFVSSDKSPEVELLGHMVVLLLIFQGNFILFSIVIVLVYIFTNKAQGFHSLYILANILFLIFLVKAFVTAVRRKLIVVFICTSLMIDHPFVPVGPSVLSSLEKCLFKSSVHFLIRYLQLLLLLLFGLYEFLIYSIY